MRKPQDMLCMQNAAGPVSDQLKQAEITEKEPIPRREDIFVVDHRIKYASDDQVLMLLLGQNRVPTEFTPLGMKGMRKDPVLSQKCRPMIWHRRSAFHKVDQIGLSLTARERERIEFNFRRTHWHIALTGFFFSFIGVNDMARTTDQSGKFVLSPIAILFMNLGTIFTGILIYTIYRFYTFLAWWSPDGGALLGKDGLPLLRQVPEDSLTTLQCTTIHRGPRQTLQSHMHTQSSTFYSGEIHCHSHKTNYVHAECDACVC
jgi:hypothetical protein